MTAEHGERARYIGGCRCGSCTAANTAYQRGYRLHLRGQELAKFTGRQRRSSRTGVTWTEPTLW